MNVATQINSEQAALWNGLAGHGWVEAQTVLDELFAPLENLLIDAVSAKRAKRVLDVGCGTGATTLAAARQLGASGHGVGIDISAPMTAAARCRAEREAHAPEFICADAQSHRFDAASFDMIISRFGVMFFDDPIRAFANLRRAARDDGALRFLAWRSADENPFMTTAERAAAPLLPIIPTRFAEAPGQFAFACQQRIERVLLDSGWTNIAIQSVDVTCAFPEPELIRYFTQLGPLGRALHAADGQMRARIVETVRAAFEPYVVGDAVRFVAACWMVDAHAAPSMPHGGEE